MLEKLKNIEGMDIANILELKQALLAYDLGFSSDTITIKQCEDIEKTIDWYYNDDDAEFISSDLFNEYIEISEGE